MIGKIGAILAAAASVAGATLYRSLVQQAYYDSHPSLAHPELTMSAITYSARGDSSILEFRSDHPRPVLRDGQVLVQVKASALNPCDFKFRRNWAPGFMRPLPKIPGEDVAGIVVEVKGSDSRFREGDRVAAMLPLLGSRWGAAAEFVAVDENLVAKLGDKTSFEEAAAVPLVALTAIQGLKKLGTDNLMSTSVQKKILIQAGAGGVGSFAIQYAKKVLGMSVATTASKGKAKLLKSLGADIVIDYHSERFEDVVEDYDAALDTMSWSYEGRTLGKHSHVLRPNGYYLNVASSDWSFEGGAEKANGIITAKNAILHGLSNSIFGVGRLPHYHVITVEPDGEQLQEVLDLLSKRTIRAIIDRRFPLKEAAAAYNYLEQGHATGKVILLH
uniref:Enoyl reductase (ER) domain-containing protein n=1 Tax=Odontella aurita TaxID=265563 RepID=A0A7S4K1U1_9STRA|mmetsp:Transcript_59711/g.176946  ORF Transcript_59711/g.176946 Transcript_59711/m.176946 type:complete len:388 (+) Transcript_59711:98-1261(+)